MDRFHQVIEPVPPGPVRDRLEGVGTRLAACLDDVHRLCADAQRLAPSAALEVPSGQDGAAAQLHRRISRAATLVAQAAEAAAMARVSLRSGAAGDAGEAAAAAERAASGAEELLS